MILNLTCLSNEKSMFSDLLQTDEKGIDDIKTASDDPTNCKNNKRTEQLERLDIDMFF